MNKAISTAKVLKMLCQYERLFGSGLITSIEFKTNDIDGPCYEFNLKTEHGHTHSIKIPIMDEAFILGVDASEQ